MNLSLEAVERIFCKVLAGELFKEEADRWAYSIMQQAEMDSVVFVPKTDRERIWRGVMYLYGVDIMNAPGEYLHTDEDIKLAMLEKLGFTDSGRFQAPKRKRPMQH